MKFSKFGKKFTAEAGILSLMDDLGKALASPSTVVMMGGGNPGYIPEVQDILRARMAAILKNKTKFYELTGVYDPPQGHMRFIEACARLLQKAYGWAVGPENICLTNGSQSGFFMLFNLFGGAYEDGSIKKIRLPLAPEYIGYSDLGISPDFFVATKPKIELLANRMFKYWIDFERLTIGDETGAVCVSRPTNPTGNVITDHELHRLLDLCKQNKIPLILDNAYGVPFPGIIYSPATPLWDQNMVTCLSLSKFGLPAVRTGIIVARAEIIRAISSLNAIMALAPNSFGAMLTEELFDTGEILKISKEIIKPFYQHKAQAALKAIAQHLAHIPYRVHKVEGAMFLWLWFEDLPITSLELYERLKARGVLIVSGHYFFPGLDSGWKHQHECIRLTYSQSDQEVARGIEIMAEELSEIYQHR